MTEISPWVSSDHTCMFKILVLLMVNSEQLPPEKLTRQLQEISLRYGEPFRSGKIKLLGEIFAVKSWKASEILSYHDTLLSMLAWPENKKMLELTKKTMNRLMTGVKETIASNKWMEIKLSGTGLPGTEITGRFSYAITRWLADKFGDKVQLHSSEANDETVRLFFQQLMPAVEYENISSGELDLLQRIKKLRRKSNIPDLKWLLALIETSPLTHRTKEFLFNELKIFVTWKLAHPVCNRSVLSIPVKKNFYHRNLDKTPDIKRIQKIKLPPPTRLSSAQKEHLVDVAKATLVFLYRETDPFTFASANTVKLFRLERGISIALYSMDAEHRLSIESYIGYLVFKNGIAVSYGGGWIFGERCQFGINILEPFRGGESAYIFSQLIRLYHQHFNVKRFVVKPYQFGKNNKEALESGAFWFYYKHGFRSVDVQLQKLSDSEWEKKKTDRNYRTPVDILKKFTGSNMMLAFSETAPPDFDPSSVSLAITDFINEEFNGNRMLAMAECEKKTKEQLKIKKIISRTDLEKRAFQQWSLLTQAVLVPAAWSKKEKKQLLLLIQAKGHPDEFHFIRLLQKHRRLWKDLTAKFS